MGVFMGKGVVTELFNNALNDFDAKESARRVILRQRKTVL